MKNKEELREYYLALRQGFPQEVVSEASQQIKNRFFDLKEVIKAQKFLLYYSFRNEIKTEGIIKGLLHRKKEIYLPFTKPEEKKLGYGRIIDPVKDLTPGNYGIMEPIKESFIKPTDLNIIVVPGVVFCLNGYRLGYGGGYYDRFLTGLPGSIIKIGLTYHELLVEALPLDEHDIPVDIIITDQGINYTGSGRNESL